MKKALIITYYWPPSGGAGVQRWLKFTKHLRQFGWEPVIYTPENPEIPAFDATLATDIPDNITVLKTPIWEPYTAYKKLVGMKQGDRINSGFLSEKKKSGIIESLSVWIRGNLFIPDARKFWIKPSVRYLTRYLSDHPADVIITTGPPHSVHLIGMELKRITGICWLADFRDPWTGIYYFDQLKLSRLAKRKHSGLEKKVLQQADGVTVVGNFMKEEFSRIVKRNYCVIPNGFDEDDLEETGYGQADQKFSLSHFGTIYPLANPVLFWKVIAEKLADDSRFAEKLQIKLVGSADHTVMSAIQSNGLEKFVRKIGYLPHKEVIREMQKSQVLLLLVNNTPQAKVILTGKLFEYLAVRRPVLCLGPDDGDAAALLKETNAGKNADYSDEISMRKILDEYFSLYLTGNLDAESRNTGQFSRRELTRRMAEVLNDLGS
ncbi:MAG TPA: glycosyltransferase [Bacteroidales bacterium]|nr:glycosyltransferase [Bacteroidales bacterium]HPT01069.1 glycosyltransferase [Bacteroidales bacterium]